MFETIIVEQKAHVVTLTLNRPDRLNSFNVRMHEEVAKALADTVGQGDARALVITGAGRGFCAGQDLSDRAVAPGGDRVDLGLSLDDRYNPLIRRLADIPIPTICAVNGVAAGAGANIALACDIVIAAKSAKFIQPFVNIGLMPDSGGTWILPRLIGQARALGLALTAQPLPAEQAKEWGMIWDVADDDQLGGATASLAEKLASMPTLAIARIKQAIRAGWSNSLDVQLDLEREGQRALGYSADYREGVAAFMEKRQPSFSGR